MIRLVKTISYSLFMLLTPILYSMSTSNELIFYKERNLPIRDAISHVAKNSGKKVIFDSRISGTSSFSINGIPWRQVLDSFLKVHNLSINESRHALFIQENNPLETIQKFSESNKGDLLNSKLDSSLNKGLESNEKTIDDELEIKGVSGSHKNLKAIVNYRGRNQTWSVGNMIDKKYRVVKIEEDGLTLLDLSKNDEVVFKFY